MSSSAGSRISVTNPQPFTSRSSSQIHSMGKSLCDLKKNLKKDFASYVALVNAPTHICKKCGRVANSKKLLCKPTKLAIVSRD